MYAMMVQNVTYQKYLSGQTSGNCDCDAVFFYSVMNQGNVSYSSFMKYLLYMYTNKHIDILTRLEIL